jgi:hypothetical protein
LLTDEKTMSLPAPDGPLTTETMRLGAMAMTRVIRFRTQFFILMSRNPCKYNTSSIPSTMLKCEQR